MHAGNYVQTVVALHKTAFQSSFNALSMVQELTENAIQLACAQVPWIPDQGKSMIEHWVGSMQEGRSTFQQAMNKSFDQMAEALGRQASEVRPQTTELVQKMADHVAASGRQASETAQKMAQAVIGDQKKSPDGGNGRKKRAYRRSA